MKKRMIYGVKEVKKHIKLRKLKCIIIAVDIENVESQGYYFFFYNLLPGEKLFKLENKAFFKK